MVWGRAVRCLLASSSLVFGVACDAVLGIDDLPRASVDAGTGVIPIAYASKDCELCGDAQCAKARDACLGDASCRAIFACLANCAPGKPSCRADCENRFSLNASSSLYQDFDGCRRKQCTAVCYGGDGLASMLDGQCGCLDTLCAAESLACVRSGFDRKDEQVGGCERAIACIAEHVDPDNYVDCVTTMKQGGPERYALLDCAHRSLECTTCPLPTGELSCVDKFKYSNNRMSAIDFTLAVQDFTGADYPGAGMRACSPASGATCLPLATADGPTGANGKSTLKLPIDVDGGFGGYFEVTPKPGADPPLWSTIVFTGRKLHVHQEDLLSTLLLGEFVFDLYAAQLEKTVDPAKGHVIGAIHDCIWGRVAGARIGSIDNPDALDDPGATLVYLRGSDIAMGASTTTVDGSFGILNYSPGPHTLVVRRDGKIIAKLPIYVRASTLTDANVYPEEQ